MATVRKYIAKTDKQGRAQLMMRVTATRRMRARIRTGIFVPAARWSQETERIVKPRADRRLVAELSQLEELIADAERAVMRVCEQTDPEDVTKEMLELAVMDVTGNRRRTSAEREAGSGIVKPKDPEQIFYDTFNHYIETAGFSQSSVAHFKVLLRIIERFARYQRKRSRGWRLSFGVWDADLLRDFDWFLTHEPEVHALYPDIYEAVPVSVRSGRRITFPPHKGENAKSGDLKRFRTFWRWAMRNCGVERYPFRDFEIKGAVYGTPFYLTKEERDALADFDFSARPALGVQRDIFIFHCLVGCRVSDLREMRASSVVRGAVEYIPRKTKEERAETVRVPLCARACEILERYAGWRASRREEEADPPLLPFISDQKYNEAIKEMLRLAGITRPVTVLNSLTREEERKPICEVASSHMARRTFIGTLYKQVKDPNLVGSLSGHKEGSRAFARYRDIDEETKRGLIDLL